MKMDDESSRAEQRAKESVDGKSQSRGLSELIIPHLLNLYGSTATARDFEIYAPNATFEDPLMRAHGVKQIKSAFYSLPKANHRISTHIQRRIYGHSTNVEIRPLNEEKAVQAATDLIGELFIFSVAGAALIFEVQRSARSEARKEEARRQEIEAMKQREEELAKELENLKQKLVEIEQHAKGRGLSGILHFKTVNGQESSKSATPA